MDNFISFEEQKRRIPLFDERDTTWDCFTCTDRTDTVIQRNAGLCRPD